MAKTTPNLVTNSTPSDSKIVTSNTPSDLKDPQIVRREKGPRRVEAGKRLLAAISKQAREEEEREEAMLGSQGRESNLWSPFSTPGPMVVLTTAGVVVALATLWYTRKEYQMSTRDHSSGPCEDHNSGPSDDHNSGPRE